LFVYKTLDIIEFQGGFAERKGFVTNPKTIASIAFEREENLGNRIFPLTISNYFNVNRMIQI
jgi:hypothetical protein